jgi:hypothetical protein
VEQLTSAYARLDMNRFSASLPRVGANVMYSMTVNATTSERLLKTCWFQSGLN